MTQGDLQIRPFRDEDEPSIVELWRVCFPDDPPRNEPRRAIARKRRVQPELFLVGLLNGRVVCTALAGFDGYRGWVHRVATAPEHRQRGFARRMMSAVESRLEDLGCPKLNLQVRATNDTVVGFYKRLEYEVEDRISFGKVLGPRADPPAE